MHGWIWIIVFCCLFSLGNIILLFYLYFQRYVDQQTILDEKVWLEKIKTADMYDIVYFKEGDSGVLRLGFKNLINKGYLIKKEKVAGDPYYVKFSGDVKEAPPLHEFEKAILSSLENDEHGIKILEPLSILSVIKEWEITETLLGFKKAYDPIDPLISLERIVMLSFPLNFLFLLPSFFLASIARNWGLVLLVVLLLVLTIISATLVYRQISLFSCSSNREKYYRLYENINGPYQEISRGDKATEQYRNEFAWYLQQRSKTG